MATTNRLKRALARAGRPERTIPVVFAAHLVAELEQLERDYAAALVTDAAGAESLESGAEAAAIRERIQRVRADLVESTVIFRLRALEPHVYAEMRDQHPPRPGNRIDLNVGFNRDTFIPALVRACTVDPHPDEDDWKLIFGEPAEEGEADTGEQGDAATVPPRRGSLLSHYYWTALGATAWNINEAAVAVPFSSAGFTASPISGGGSAPHNGSASASAASTDGNRAARRGTTGTRKGGSSGR